MSMSIDIKKLNSECHPPDNVSAAVRMTQDESRMIQDVSMMNPGRLRMT